VSKSLTPIKAIRAKCRECGGNHTKVIRRCQAITCPLFPYRMGKRPTSSTDPKKPETKNSLKEFGVTRSVCTRENPTKANIFMENANATAEPKYLKHNLTSEIFMQKEQEVQYIKRKGSNGPYHQLTPSLKERLDAGDFELVSKEELEASRDNGKDPKRTEPRFIRRKGIPNAPILGWTPALAALVEDFEEVTKDGKVVIRPEQDITE
jgi:hypothetical protein